MILPAAIITSDTIIIGSLSDVMHDLHHVTLSSQGLV